MNEPQVEGKKYRLSNLFVESIGLVRRGANKSPFFFVKSESGQQGEGMSDKAQDIQVETPTAEELEEFSAWKVAQANSPATSEPVDPPAEPTANIPAAPEPTVDFAEMLALQETRLTEGFAAQLKAEQAKTTQLAEAFAGEQRKRRLREFTDVASTFSLPITGVEQFGEDLMAIKDSVPEEAYDRLLATLRASDEAVRQGDLFSQFAQPVQTDEYGDPFLAKVKVIETKILENDPMANSHEAFSVAMEKAQERFPRLAAEFALGQTGGA